MEVNEALCKIRCINALLKANFYLLSENKKGVEWTNLQPRKAKVKFSYYSNYSCSLVPTCYDNIIA